jgi:hypothetical protein
VELGHQVYEARLDARVGGKLVGEVADQLADLAQTAHRQAVSAENAIPRKIRKAGIGALVDVRHSCELVAEGRGTDRASGNFEAVNGYLKRADQARDMAEHLFSLPCWKFWQHKTAITATYEAWDLPKWINFNE